MGLGDSATSEGASSATNAALAAGTGALAAGSAAMSFINNPNPHLSPKEMEYNTLLLQSAGEDAETFGWMQDLFQYGDITPYGDTPVPVYESSEFSGKGYFFDHKKGIAVTESKHLKRSNNNKIAVTGKQKVRDENGNKIERFEWIPAELKTGVSEDTGLAAIEKQKAQTYNELFPKIAHLEELGLDAAVEIMPYQTEAQIAQNQYSIDVLPEKAAADIAGYKYTQEIMPEKTAAEKAMYGEQQMKIEERAPIYSQFYNQALNGIDVREAMSGASQEVAHQFNTNKDVTLQNLRALGVDPSSGTAIRALGNLGLDRAKAMATASNFAKKEAEDTNFNRMQTALTI